MTPEEKLALIKINAFNYLRTDWLERLLEIFGTGQEILKQTPQTLSEEGKISLETAEYFLKSALELDAEKEIENTAKAGGHIYIKGEEGYPEEFLNIKEPPLVIYVRGELNTHLAPTVAIVGTRKITPYGRRAATKLAGDLADAGVIIVSGLARGIDSVAHAEAVKRKKPTWALIGTGIGRCYPAENKELALGIIENGGALISEYPFMTAPLAQHFPRRNRLIAALSRVALIVEGEVKSGALITAKMALEQGLDVFAVPGPIDSPTSGGPNKLIKEGASICLDARDIIDALPVNIKSTLKTQDIYKEKEEISDLSPEEAKIIEAIGTGESTIDELSVKLNMDVPSLSTVLFSLEISGYLRCEDGKYSKAKI